MFDLYILILYCNVIYLFIYSSNYCRGQDSSVGIATPYGLDGPGIESRWRARFSAPVQTGTGAYKPLIQWVPGLFLEGKRPGRGVDHPPSSSAEVKERVQPYLYSPYVPMWPVLG